MTIRKNWTSDKASKCLTGLVIIFFAVFFAYGCMTYDDYGVSSDEPLQRRHSLVMYNDLFLKGQSYHTLTINTETMPSLEDYGVNYGVILQLPLVFVEHLNDFEMTHQEIYSMRHFYTFLWFFVSAIAFYFLAKRLTNGNKVISLLGTMMYILCPRTLADSFYNIKDGLCLSLFTISTYWAVEVVRKLSIKNIIFFVVFAALCTASRIVGGVVVGACFLVLLIKGICEKEWKRLIKYGLLMCLLFVGLFVVISPNVWEDIPGKLWAVIKTFSNYTTWDSEVKYMGEWINGGQLPWHYLFVWILMTVPSVYLLLAIAGGVNGVKYCLKNIGQYDKEQNRGWINLMLFLILVIPFCYVIVVRPVLYNGWRHFYFMYTIIVCWAVIGLYRVFETRKTIRTSALVAVAGTFVYVMVWIGMNHPYEYIYYNRWIKEYAEDNFQRDYWFVSEQEALEYILDTDDRKTIPVYSYQGYAWLFDGTRENPLSYVPSADLAEYAVVDENDFEMSYLFTKEKDIIADDMVIRSVYKKNYEITRNFTLSVGEDETYYKMDGIMWNKTVSEQGVDYTAVLNEAVPTDVLAVLISDERLIEENLVDISLSADGENWHVMNQFPRYSEYGGRLAAECIVHELKYIRVTLDKAWQGSVTIKLLMCEYAANADVGDYGYNSSIIGLSSNVETNSYIFAMIDGKIGSRWTTGSQLPGMDLQVIMNQPYEITRIKLDLGESPWDYPRNLMIYASNDGVSWEVLDTKSEDQQWYYFEPIVCQYLRFELGETTEPVNSNWSIYELEIYSAVR